MVLQAVESSIQNLATFGARLTLLRQEAKLTQLELAQRAGLTQPMVSRLERAGQVQRVPAGMIPLLANGLGIDQKKLVAGTPLEKLMDDTLDEDAGQHLVYCPNPYCCRNKIRQPSNRFQLCWTSAEMLCPREYDALQYCGSCHTKLIRACPSCGKRIRQAPEHFCSRCGQQIHDRPTAQELEALCLQFGDPVDRFPHLEVDSQEEGTQDKKARA